MIDRFFNSSGDHFAWNMRKTPNETEEFEDLDFLFCRSPTNRGLLRLDFDEAAALFRLIRSLHNAKGTEIGRFFGAARR